MLGKHSPFGPQIQFLIANPILMLSCLVANKSDVDFSFMKSEKKKKDIIFLYFTLE